MEMLKRRLNMLFALFAFYSDALTLPGAFQCVFFLSQLTVMAMVMHSM